MRYAQGGGLTAEGRRRREQVRLEAVKRFEQRAPASVIAAHRQLPGGNLVLVWDNLSVHLRAELRNLTGAQAWLLSFIEREETAGSFLLRPGRSSRPAIAVRYRAGW